MTAKRDAEKHPWKRYLLKYFMVTLGILLDAIALELFLVPNSVLDGGLTGISLMIQYKTGWPLGLIVSVFNLPFIFLGWKQVGKRFAVAYTYALAVFTLFTQMFHHVAPVTENELLSVVFGGFLLGAGVGLVLRGGACIDGTELVALMISRKSNVSTGTVILIFNLIIFTVASLLFGVDRALLSLLTYYIASRIIDKVEEGLDTAKQVIVITDDAEPIADAIYKRLGRTVTISSARGLVSGKKEMLYVVITRLELPELREIVEESDESAFITISDVNEIIGKHVQKVDKAVVEELEA
ncbi:MAG: YitT family protein [Clostridiales bacterium]|nr:YitT family protein [Clostridia bacterium]MBQ1312962.1 YitT family protein [Clostridia bacterium]MBQ1530307.1 YitT family protein [Clostridia bacterium]NLD29631.1 YitT family protein [Clostridiales bacterium]